MHVLSDSMCAELTVHAAAGLVNCCRDSLRSAALETTSCMAGAPTLSCCHCVLDTALHDKADLRIDSYHTDEHVGAAGPTWKQQAQHCCAWCVRPFL